METLTYAMYACLFGVVWSIVQFIRRSIDKKKSTRFKDFDIFKMIGTCFLNGVGGFIGVWILPYLTSDLIPFIPDVEPGIAVAIVSGVLGEKFIKIISSKTKDFVLRRKN